MSERHKPRIIIFDIETLPNPLATLDVWPRLSMFPGKTLKATVSTLLCVGWKLYGSKKTHVIKAWDGPNWNKDVNDDRWLCKEISKVLETADAVVTHNGKSFDWKHVQTRLMVNDLDPLPKLQHIDTKQKVKQHLYLFDNKLNTAGKALVADKKLDHQGWDLWVDCYHRKKSALNKMAKYCAQDVRLTEKVFTRLKPFLSSAEMPNHNLFQVADGRDLVCPNCGTTNFYSKGYRYTATKTYKRYHCKDCRVYFKTSVYGRGAANL